MALKDGVQGAPPPHNHAHHASSASTSSTNTLDAERADRISRLAGLERVATLRGASQHLPLGTQPAPNQPVPGYFDNVGNIHKSTVGSASASGSVGGRMTWASESDANETDKMSEDPDDGVSSAGLSDEGNASLVGFGETASSVSGPTSNPGGRTTSGMTGTTRQHLMQAGSPMEGIEDHTSGTGEGGREQARRIVGAALDAGESTTQQPLGHSDKGKALGKFYFEGK